jgi:hypothetical protein
MINVFFQLAKWILLPFLSPLRILFSTINGAAAPEATLLTHYSLLL